jgi:hypothetical protein
MLPASPDAPRRQAPVSPELNPSARGADIGGMGTEDRCERCGARLTDQIDWCGQCYAPKPPPPAAPVFRNGMLVAEEPKVTTIVMPTARSASGFGGPLGFGVVAKTAITTAIVGIGVGLFAGLRPWLEIGRPLWGLALFLSMLYTVPGALILARVWHPEAGGHHERIVTLDHEAIERVERQQRDLRARR